MSRAYSGQAWYSFFFATREKTAWETWKACEEVTSIFLSLSARPALVSDAVLEQYSLVNIDECQKHLFTKKGMPYVLPKQHWCSTSKGLCIKVGISGATCWKSTLTWRLGMGWSYSWKLLPEALVFLPESYCTVAEASANARELHGFVPMW